MCIRDSPTPQTNLQIKILDTIRVVTIEVLTITRTEPIKKSTLTIQKTLPEILGLLPRNPLSCHHMMIKVVPRIKIRNEGFHVDT